MIFFVAWWAIWFSAGHALLMDEPDHNGVPPSTVHARYLAAKRTSSASLTVNFVTCRHAAPYRASVDVLAADDYPFYRHVSARTALQEWDQVVRQCVSLAQSWGIQPPIMVAQAFGGLRDGFFGTWRCPTAYERQRMVSDAYTLGAAGVLLYRPSEKRYWCK